MASQEHAKAVLATDFYLAYCSKISCNPATVSEAYLKSFLNQVKMDF